MLLLLHIHIQAKSEVRKRLSGPPKLMNLDFSLSGPTRSVDALREITKHKAEVLSFWAWRDGLPIAVK